MLLAGHVVTECPPGAQLLPIGYMPMTCRDVDNVSMLVPQPMIVAGAMAHCLLFAQAGASTVALVGLLLWFQLQAHHVCCDLLVMC